MVGLINHKYFVSYSFHLNFDLYLCKKDIVDV